MVRKYKIFLKACDANLSKALCFTDLLDKDDLHVAG